MSTDLTTAEDADRMAEGRKEPLRKTDRSEVDPDTLSEQRERIDPEYVAELQESSPEIAAERASDDSDTDDQEGTRTVRNRMW